MKRAFLKTAFILLVCGLGFLLLVASTFLLEGVFSQRPDSNGHFRDNSGMIVIGVLQVRICLAIADRSISAIFRRARLTDERWSIFKSRWRH
jgi:hypothetical protein